MKKFGKLLCAILGVGFLVTGCATVGSIKNDYGDVIFSGNSATLVSDHLYFGNSFADYSSFSNDGDYSSATAISYLSRVDTKNISAENGDFSPKSVEKVASEVTAQTNAFQFVLGNKIYYATPNRQKFKGDDGKSDFYFNYSTFYRSDLSGDHKEKIYTTNGEISSIEVLKFDGKYYIVMLAGTNLVKIQIGSKVSASTIASDVKSVALPKTFEKDKIGSTLDWNGQIFYTTDKNDPDNTSLSGSYVNKVSISGGDVKSYFVGHSKTLTFIARERDVMFYTYTGDTTEIYKFDSNAVQGQPTFGNSSDRFYSASSISNLNLVTSQENVVKGYLFQNSTTLCFSTTAGKKGSISLTHDGEALSSYNILLVSGQNAYISTTTGIYSIDISSAFSSNGGVIEVECSEIVTMTAIYDGTLYAFDGTYIYYYAQLEALEDDEADEDDTTEETDETYYLYRARVSAPNGYQLLSLTKYDSRHTKG